MNIPALSLRTGFSRTSILSIGLLATALMGSGCAVFHAGLPQTLGEQNSGYTYVPLDPLPVEIVPGAGCSVSAPQYEPILAALPDNAVRIAVGSFDASGKLSFGPLQIGTSGNTYQVVLDYINVDTTNTYFDIWYSKSGNEKNFSIYDASTLPADAKIRVERFDPKQLESRPSHGDTVVIPVYVGLGLRLTATVNVLKGSVNLSSLGAIAAGAQAGRVTGSLVVQTLGITGSQVTTSLPLPSELNSTTVQQAILSLGAIKAVLYDEAALKRPRVTGIYNPIGSGGQPLINAIVSELAKQPIEWKQPCVGSVTRTQNTSR